MITYKKNLNFSLKTCPNHQDKYNGIRLLQDARPYDSLFASWQSQGICASLSEIYWISFNCQCNFYVVKKTGRIISGSITELDRLKYRLLPFNERHTDITQRNSMHYCSKECGVLTPVFKE